MIIVLKMQKPHMVWGFRVYWMLLEHDYFLRITIQPIRPKPTSTKLTLSGSGTATMVDAACAPNVASKPASEIIFFSIYIIPSVFMYA